MWKPAVAAVLAAALALAPGAAAQQPLILSELISEARRANPDLAAARKRWEAAQARVGVSTGLPAPRIGVEFEEIPKGTVDLNKSTIMYQLIQSLPFPGKLSMRKKVAVAEAQMAAAEFRQKEWDIASMLKSNYYQLFLIDRELEIQQRQAALLQQAAASAQARYAGGAGTQSEFLQIQAEALEASNQVEVSRHRRLALSAHINHLLNRPVSDELGAPESLQLLPVPESPEQLLGQAFQVQPELLVFQYSAERAEAAWRLSKRELLPDIETMLELRDPSMGPVGPWDLTLALVLPFWFWTKQRYGVKAALYDKESAQAAYQAVRNEIARRIHEQWHEAKAAYETATLSRDRLIPLAEQNVAAAMSAYQGGRGPFADLSAALGQLYERRTAYYRELIELEQRIVMLEQASGLPLREAHKTKEPERR